MSIFAEFELDAEMFAFSETFETLPEAVIEVERVIASNNVLTPYFWVSNVSFDEFETAGNGDPSIKGLRQIDCFEDMALYRAEWTDALVSTTSLVVDIASVILDATGTDGQWEIEMRFDNPDQLSEFQTFCSTNGIDITVRRLFELSQPLTGSQYGLTEKQQEALVAAWDAGYFETPRKTTLSEIADDLGITQQSLSNRLRRGHQMLIANTLTIEPSHGA